MTRAKLAKQLTPEFIQDIKRDHTAFAAFINEPQNTGQLVYVLEKLGRIENPELKSSLVYLLDNEKSRIRELALKNLAKMRDSALLTKFSKYARSDQSTAVRQEAVAAIGRLGEKQIIPVLLEYLGDEHPQIVIQAIRGLLPFSKELKVAKSLESIKQHPNEYIRDSLRTSQQASSNSTKRQTGLIDYSKLRNKVILGDVAAVLKRLPAESIDLTFTSPPYYNARDYSVYKSYAAYLKFLEQIFKGVHRATKEGRFCIINTSPVIVPRMSRAHASKRYPIPYDLHPCLIKLGWEFIDDIVWVKPESSVKNRNAGFLQHRKPLGYKPNAVTEMLMVYRKKTAKLIDWNMRQYDRLTIERSKVRGDYETRNIWDIAPASNKQHSAVFPQELCTRVIQFYSYLGDLVFDPFGGSGTLGLAASKLERYFLLAEQESKYFEYMKKHLDNQDWFSAENETEFITLEQFNPTRTSRNNQCH